MQVDLRMPNITGTDREQLSQIRSYLYQFIPQLQWALNSLDTSASSNYVVQQANANSPQQQSSSPEVSFSDLKSLIIKSADIVDAYYEEISRRLSGKYVAESDFGTYKKETELLIEENSEGVTEYYSNKQWIESSIENLNIDFVDVKAHIKSGLLYEDEDGIPVYGIEVGQRNIVDGEEVFNKYARFTSDRLSFYDQNGDEVAYISGFKLYITHAEYTGTVKFGAFLVDTSKGFSLKWVGRG